MTHTPLLDDPDVTRAWTAFARHDAGLAPSPGLDRRVLTAVRARTPSMPAAAGRAARSRRWPAVAAVMAAGLVATIVAARWVRPVAPIAPPAGAMVVSAAPAFVPATAPAIVAADVAADVVAATPRRSKRRPMPTRSGPAAAPAVTLPAGFEVDGPLQVIRVRVQASALDAFGVQLAGPALAGLVDVDLVVGPDGWPRDVRRIRPVPAIARPE